MATSKSVTKSDFTSILDRIQAEEIEVCGAGQAEYAHSDANVFANFDRVSSALNLPREHVLLVYALKHWDGIVAHVNGHRSQREDVRGRIKDLRMYLAILWAMIEAEDPQDVMPIKTQIKDSFAIFPAKG